MSTHFSLSNSGCESTKYNRICDELAQIILDVTGMEQLPKNIS